VRRGFRCKKEILDILKQKYDEAVVNEYKNDSLEALKKFDDISEHTLRGILH